MPVHTKLMQARIKLQAMELKKSGENKFAGYKYFELGDFLPQTMSIFHSLGLASVVSFGNDLATLTILDTEDGQTIAITSPMSEANLKGAHPIQNLGAVQSYQRRYLWMAAMEIVEHDVIDASEPSKPAPKPPAKIVGNEGSWQISASLNPGGDVNAWLDVVERACKTALDMAQSADDVMQIFRKNKQLFDVVKSQDAAFFKTLMANYTEAKSRFSE